MNVDQIFELAERIAKLNKSQPEANRPPRRQRAPRNYKHLNNLSDANVSELLQRKWNELDQLTQVVEDRQKAKKKEDKKEPKVSTVSVAIMLLSGYPIIFVLGAIFWWSVR